MIESTDQTAIVSFTYREHGNKAEGTKILRCPAGEELKCLRSDPKLRDAEIVKIKRR